MTIKQIYHSSLDKIEQFIIGNNGVHFGGYHSSLEAAYRKIDDEDLNKNIYTYICEFDEKDFIELDDAGSHSEWIKSIEFAKKNGYKLIKYINKYEPDKNPSYLFFCEENIPVIKDIKVSKFKEVEKILDQYYY